MNNTVLEKIQHRNNEIEFANTVINLHFLLLEVISGAYWRVGTIAFLITPSKMFLHMSATLKNNIKKSSDQSIFLYAVQFPCFS